MEKSRYGLWGKVWRVLGCCSLVKTDEKCEKITCAGVLKEGGLFSYPESGMGVIINSSVNWLCWMWGHLG